LLRLDLRGTGRSELPEERESLQFPRLADDIEDLRVARGLDSIDIIAHSAGCFVSLVYAMRYPTRLSRLVLVTPSARGFGDVEDDVVRIRAGRSDEPWYPEAAEIEAELAMMPPHRRARMDRGLRVFGYARWDERAQAHAAATDAQMSLRATAGFSADDFLDHGRRLYEALQQVSARVLILVGDLDGITGVRAGQLIADALPDASVQEISGTAHYPWVDAPEPFCAALVSFLAGARPAGRLS
jgi:pimeloyl-ACP methyl ester carboxylesterase